MNTTQQKILERLDHLYEQQDTYTAELERLYEQQENGADVRAALFTLKNNIEPLEDEISDLEKITMFYEAPGDVKEIHKGAQDMSHKTPSPINTSTMSLTNERPTRYDLPTLATLQAMQAHQAPRAESAEEARGAVTELELATLAAIDAAELIAEPLSRGNMARLATKGAARLARFWRDR